MINWKSILSSFNDKPTLLEWLKLVEKALKESVLTNVLTNTKDGKTAFTFKFEDGTEIKTDYIQTQGDTGPQGPKGDKGDAGSGGTATNVDIKPIINSASNVQKSQYNAKPIRPLISFTDDDGKAGVYTKWLPILQEKNISCNSQKNCYNKSIQFLMVVKARNYECF